MMPNSTLSIQSVGSVFRLTIYFLLASNAFADIIPANRVTTWTGNVGVQGGIPNRTTIYQTLSPGATAGQINSAIASCPAGQVVFLSAGTYNLASPILLTRSDMTLRGAGPNSTIINFSTGAYAAISMSGTGYFNPTPIVSWTGGYARGSTALTVTNSSGFLAGDLIATDQTIDSTYVSNADYEGATCLGNDQTTCSHLQMELHKVVSVVGNVINITPGIFMPNYASTFSPRVMRYTTNVLHNTGIENLHFEGGAATYNLELDNAEGCWIKNVYGAKAGQAVVQLSQTYHCEIRDSNFGPNTGQSTGSYSVLAHLSSGLLIENNIIAGDTNLAAGSPIIQHGVAGSVVAYNYLTRVSSGNCVGPMITNHNPHPCFNLFEGNMAPSIIGDFYHGSSSHNTIFRNYFWGWDYNTTATIAAGSGSKTTCFNWVVRLARYNRYYNVVGNVLGSAAQPVTAPGYEDRCDTGGSLTAVFWLGFSHYLNTCDSVTITSLLRHGNWDANHQSIQWDPAISDHSIPDSLYLISKPAWFGNLTWPPMNPASPVVAVDAIPAAYRYVHGVDPPGGGGGNQSPTVSITGPADNTVVVAPGSFNITANASDSDGTVSKVEFYQGTTKLGEDTSSPFTYSWTGVAAGNYTLTAVATDNSGAATTSALVQVHVGAVLGLSFASTAGVILPPFVSGSGIVSQAIQTTDPTQGGQAIYYVNIPSTGDYTVSAMVDCLDTGSDSFFVQFDTAPTTSNIWKIAPTTGLQSRQVTWGFPIGGVPVVTFTLSAGVHPLYVVGREADAKLGTITVASTVAANVPPTVSLTAPVNGTIYMSAPATIPIAATAADSDGTIAKVEFYQNGNKIGEDASSPYNFNSTGVAAGNYVLEAKATDNSGATTTSSQISVQVIPAGAVILPYGIGIAR